MNPSFLGLLPPLLSAALLTVSARRFVARHHLGRRPLLPFFLAAVSFGALTVILTEGLGALSILSPGWLAGAWTVSAVVLYLLDRFGGGAHAGADEAVPGPRRLRGAFTRDRLAGLLLPVLLGLFLLTLTAAVVYPPNNYDSMIYHAARVMHWAQQGSVAHYPTSILLQLQGAPLSEYFLLHLRLLTGGDALFNLVQWLSFLLAVLAVYGSAEMSFPRSGLTAAVLAATLPAAVLQASSTQNDLGTAAWLAVSVYLGSCALRQPKVEPLVAYTALALGLAAFTKPTALIISAPLALLFFALLWSRRVPLRTLVLSAVLVGLPSLPFVARNLATFGSPYGPTRGHTNEQVSPTGVASVAIRNAALHVQVPLPGAFFSAANAGALGFLGACHGMLGIPVDDPRFSLRKKDAFRPNDCGLRARGFTSAFHEDCTGNPLHLVLFLVGLPITLVVAVRKPQGSLGWRRRVVARRASVLMASAAVAFLGMSAYFKWQPWGARLDLPVFMLACIPLGGLLAELRGSVRGLLLLVMASLAVAAACLNAIRPVSPRLLTTPVDRRASYFANRPDLLEPYSQIVRAIRDAGCRRIGYEAGRDPFEYPFWVLLGEGGYAFRFEHVGVAEPAGRELRTAPFKPCAVISPGGGVGQPGPYRLFLEGRP
ncbi:MAG: glycosyltransferase family 39 protein [Acidobacteria bacterium]|nr:glycosyltransferase family 39 protein [Acidobacteriota bacterium]